MTTTCDRVRALLEEHGLEALRTDDVGRDHAVDCEQCFAFVEALGEVDRALAALPMIDAPDALVERVLAAPRLAATVSPAPRPRRWARWTYGLSGIAALLLVGLFSSTMLMTARDSEPATVTVQRVQSSPPSGAVVGRGEEGKMGKKDANAKGKGGYFAYGARVESSDAERTLHWRPEEGDLENTFDRGRFREATEDKQLEAPPPPPGELGLGAKTEIAQTEIVKAQIAKPVIEKFTVNERSQVDLPASGALDHAQRQLHIDVSKETAGQDNGVKTTPAFLPQRDALLGLAFQPAEGYWQNTYVPGDPTFRYLANQLTGEGIEDQARPYDQPFDAPKGAALAVSIASDRAAVEGPSRVLVQVGLKGALEHAHRRPAMNVALVVDATGPLDVETAKAIRSTVLSFVQKKEAGDRMALLVAGRAGAPAVEPERFAYGTVAVAIQAALSDGPSDASGEPLTTTEALRRAIELVAGADDETAPLGASAVVLIVPRSLGIEVERLADLAHQSAVNGIVVSTIGVGQSTVLPELDRIALSGQGNRRLLADASQAEGAVDRELASVSRVVARAVRLRIRLAAGVKLVNVLGSRRLDGRETRRVREAEKSLDLRLSKHLGIEADRGKDEDGIEIVIPSYYADDEHPILLDVVVPGPGPVADVQARYKDLVYLRNGVARAHLELRRGRTPRGPMQMMVLKNLTARRIADDLADASQLLGVEDVDGARGRLTETLAALSELEQLLPQDPELRRDEEMLRRYRDTIVDPDRGLIDSMAFAAKAKILPIPLTSQR